MRTIDLNRLIPGDTFTEPSNETVKASANGLLAGVESACTPTSSNVGNITVSEKCSSLYLDVNASYDALITNHTHQFSAWTQPVGVVHVEPHDR